MRILAVAFLLAATTVLSTAAARAEARTVRIEPRPFYGCDGDTGRGSARVQAAAAA
jgi:hypothetical protein